MSVMERRQIVKAAGLCFYCIASTSHNATQVMNARDVTPSTISCCTTITKIQMLKFKRMTEQSELGSPRVGVCYKFCFCNLVYSPVLH